VAGIEKGKDDPGMSGLGGLGGRPFFAALLQGDGPALAIGIAALGAIPLTVGLALVVLSRLQRG
jgi:hypothetical protein